MEQGSSAQGSSESDGKKNNRDFEETTNQKAKAALDGRRMFGNEQTKSLRFHDRGDPPPNAAVPNRFGSNGATAYPYQQTGEMDSSRNSKIMIYCGCKRDTDKAFTIPNKIAEALEKDKYKIWIDPKNVHYGHTEACSEAIKNNDIVIICISQTLLETHNYKQVVNNARTKKKPVIFVGVEKTDNEKFLEYQTENYPPIEFWNADFHEKIKKLLYAIEDARSNSTEHKPLVSRTSSIFECDLNTEESEHRGNMEAARPLTSDCDKHNKTREKASPNVSGNPSAKDHYQESSGELAWDAVSPPGNTQQPVVTQLSNLSQCDGYHENGGGSAPDAPSWSADPPTAGENHKLLATSHSTVSGSSTISVQNRPDGAPQPSDSVVDGNERDTGSLPSGFGVPPRTSENHNEAARKKIEKEKKSWWRRGSSKKSKGNKSTHETSSAPDVATDVTPSDDQNKNDLNRSHISSTSDKKKKPMFV